MGFFNVVGEDFEVLGDYVVKLHFWQATVDWSHVEKIVAADLLYGFDVLLDEGVAQVPALFACQNCHKSLLCVHDFRLFDDTCYNHLLPFLLLALCSLLALLLLITLCFFFDLFCPFYDDYGLLFFDDLDLAVSLRLIVLALCLNVILLLFLDLFLLVNFLVFLIMNTWIFL